MRHGATDWNLESRYQGTTDTRLCALGIDQAKGNGLAIKKAADGGDIDLNKITLVSSPLRRAAETASIISKSLNLTTPAEFEPAFRELSMGRWEGLTSQEVKDRFYEERKSRKTNRWDFKPVDGESMAERKHGIESALQKLPPHTVIVTHSVILRIVCFLLGDGSREDCAVREIPHDEILLWNGVKLHRQPFN